MLRSLDNRNSKQLSGRKEICICQQSSTSYWFQCFPVFLNALPKAEKGLFKSERNARYHLPLLQPPWSNSDNRTHPCKPKWE